MPVFLLDDSLIFPPAKYSDEKGIVAIGGDLSPERLLNAYRQGIFPWYSEGEPILWWSPDPRFVLFPDDIRISKSMRQVINRETFEISYDRAFSDVIMGCRKPRNSQDGTWITDEMIEGYTGLHERGYAHSVEAWHEGKLAGGLYGISLGRCFFGESMYADVSNASKAAFITLTKKLSGLGFTIIDCQVYTEHLKNLGAKSIPRKRFLNIIEEDLKYDTLRGNWGELPEFKNS
jgi:leucyl/phenylalanyl-tRNA---protein transferase